MTEKLNTLAPFKSDYLVLKFMSFSKCISYIFVDSTDKTIENEFNQVCWSISVSPEFRKLKQEDPKAGQPG